MRTRDYSAFLNEVSRSAQNKSFPLRVMFELTYRCNFFCRHCYIPLSYRKKPELKTKKVYAILDELAKIGCLYLGFTGGEPFLRKDILPILGYAGKKGFITTVYTNGSLIDARTARILAGLKPGKIDITIPAISRLSFEKITGLKGSQQKVFRAIRELKKNRIPLGFKTCVLQENQGEIAKIKRFCRSLGAGHRLDNILSRRIDGSSEPYLCRGKIIENPARGGDLCP
ncbi:MAG: radical SAM protein [Candidatus Omnitrophica bacterium]|nr:radical SAM protein [Candidatus Omnitrophota bacterium]